MIGGKILKKLTTSDRLKEIMNKRRLRQIDILEMTKTYSEKYNIKMNKSDISQYVSGLVEPGQEKLSILGMALNVSEAWLMGYNVPMDRDYIHTTNLGVVSLREVKLINNLRKLNEVGQQEAIKRVEELTYIDKYAMKEDSHLLPNAAHEIDGASDKDKAHDDAIMDDEDF
jgi:transcriptional regulator with XRE-family HTH domain